MGNFSRKHPFLDSLIKRIIRIVVTWNVVVACIIGTLLFFGIIGAIGTIFSNGAASTGLVYQPIYGFGSKELLSIKVSGVIMGSNDAPANPWAEAFSEPVTYGYDIKERLITEADSGLSNGVILEIDSPGGTIFGSRAIADGVAYYKAKTKKPVYAHIQGQGASGAYWAAASADKIFTDYGTDVGSIGVIMGPFQYYDKPVAADGGLLGGGIVTQNGIETVTITAGTSKDIGNPYRKLTEQEVQTLQKMINNEYDEFVKYVSVKRDIPESDIRDKIGAMIYDSKTALELKLIDQVGSRQDAYEALARTAGIGDDYYVVRVEQEPTAFDALFGALTPKPQTQASSANFCKLTQLTLAYHGDSAAFCK